MAIEAIFLLGYFKEMFLFCQGTCILNDLMELFKVLTFWLLTISVAAEEGQQWWHAYQARGYSRSWSLQAEEDHYNRSHFWACWESTEAQHR